MSNLPPHRRRKNLYQKRSLRRCHFHFFVSYAHENKEEIIIPLIQELDKFSIRYFLDSKNLNWGDSLHYGLSQGLHRSCHFVAVVSKQYIEKDWTMVELKAAFQAYIVNGKGSMLLIMVGSQRQRLKILKQLPFLEDLYYIVWNNNASHIATQLARHICKN